MHFFVEHILLSSETNSYGPVSGSLTTRYNVTSKFSLTAPAKAFACQDSMMLVLPSTDASLINVILQPIKGLGIPFSKIQFYVYRGLLKSSFITGTAIKPKTDTDKSDFIKRLWDNHERRKAADPTLPDPTPADFGFIDDSTKNPTIEEIFNRSFTEVSSHLVNEGEWIGNFGASCGFEIITDTDHLVIDVNYVRQLAQVFDISNFVSGAPDDKFNIDKPEGIFNLRVEKEKTLNYIDPAAFWGMHYETGIDIYDSTVANKKRKIKKDDLYTTIINKYTTKNRIYLDIRSEYGYSYNFYQNYGERDINGNILDRNNIIMINQEDPPNPRTAVSYHKDGWSIFYIDNPLIANSSNKFKVNLRTDDNIKPLIFLENPKLLGSRNKSNFIDDKQLLDGTNQWSKGIKLESPFRIESSQKVNIACYLRLQYFRQTTNQSSPLTVFKNANFLDCIFGNFPNSTNPSSTSTHKLNSKKHFIIHQDFAYVAESGAYFNTDTILIYSKAKFIYISSKTSRAPYSNSEGSNPNLVESTVLSKDVFFSKHNIKESSVDIGILDIVAYNSGENINNREYIFLLGLKRDEFERLLNHASLIDDTNKYPAVSEILGSGGVGLKDDENKPFRKFKLNIRGFDETNLEVSQSNLHPDIFVYSLSENIFSSAGFASLQNIPFTLPDPELLQPWTNVGTNHYNSTTIISINDKNTSSIPQVQSITKNARVFFPADVANVTKIKKPDGSWNISAKEDSYPMIVIVHGNGHQFRNYDNLCKKLAANGFIVASINCNQFLTNVSIAYVTGTKHFFMRGANTFYFDSSDSGIYTLTGKRIGLGEFIPPGTATVKYFGPGMGALGRANTLFLHLAHLETLLGPKVRLNNIGIMGHSRGGESVITAARDGSNKVNPDPAKFQIKAIASLAPTDQYDKENLTQTIPYFVLYGSKDGDVKGNMPSETTPFKFRRTGFSLWDRVSNNNEKSMVFVYKATHNGFITRNDDDPNHTTLGSLLPKAVQQIISRSYMTAFFRMTLKGELFWRPYFTGEEIPGSVKVGTTEVYSQYRTAFAGASVIIDDFSDDVGSDKNNELVTTHGDTVSFTNTVGNFHFQGFLRDMDDYSPHSTKGLEIKVLKDTEITIDFISPIDVSAFNFLSFRIGFVVGFIPDLSSFIISIDGKPSIHPITIPKPSIRSDNFNLSKSSLLTVRVPLSSFTGIDPSNIKKLSFLFTSNKEGRIDMDDIEFTN